MSNQHEEVAALLREAQSQSAVRPGSLEEDEALRAIDQARDDELRALRRAQRDKGAR